MTELGNSFHGKERVRLAKVLRKADGMHEFAELRVRIELRGGTTASFTTGDNSAVVATDTCKNHVYLLAKEHPCSPPEQFAIDLAHRFLKYYGHIESVKVRVEDVPWKRVVGESGQDHKHGFVKDTTYRKIGECISLRTRSGTRPETRVVSKIDGLEVLKTTQSGWSNFHEDRFRTLPDTDERILATRVSASWTYLPGFSVDFDDVHTKVRTALLDEFFGPPETGLFSVGVQHSLFKMGSAVLQAAHEIEDITIELPNLHFIPCSIPVFVKNGICFEDDVYVPTDEPHGIISATVRRKLRSKL